MKYWRERFDRCGYMGTVSLDGADAALYWRQAACMYEAVRPWIPNNIDLAVEYGCGAGRMVPYVMRHAKNYVGLDILPGMIAQARASFETPNVQFMACSAFRPSYPGRVGLFWFTTVMQHITDNGELLDVLAWARINADDNCRLLGYEATAPHENKQHIKFRPMEKIDSMLASTGWRVVWCKGQENDPDHTAFAAEPMP